MTDRWFSVSGVRREPTGGSVARAQIPAASLFFRGHFRSRPILPGLALVALVERTLAERPGPSGAVLTGLRRVRFRSLIESAAELDVRLEPHQPRPKREHHFAVTRAGALVCDGVAVTGGSTPRLPPAPVPFADRTLVEEPATLFMPHRDRMALVDTLVEAGEGRGVCRAEVRPEWPLCDPGGTSGAVLVELAAQSAAAVEGWKMRQGRNEVGVALLVGIKRASWTPERIPAGTSLLVHVERTLRHESYAVFSAQVLAPAAYAAEVVLQAFQLPSG